MYREVIIPRKITTKNRLDSNSCSVKKFYIGRKEVVNKYKRFSETIPISEHPISLKELLLKDGGVTIVELSGLEPAGEKRDSSFC